MGFSKFIDSLKANDPYLELMKMIQDSSLSFGSPENNTGHANIGY
jgi:hypothetical protein